MMDRIDMEFDREVRMFFSWQADSKMGAEILREALKEAAKHLEAMGIKLIIEEDTRDRTGAPDIAHTIFQKIEQSDVFLADLTPVTEINHKELKLIPNPNVMFETGYAFHSLGDNRVMLMAYLTDGQTLSALPFDIKARRITGFSDKSALRKLPKWIMDIVTHVENENKVRQEARSCTVLFDNNSTEITLTPRYKTILYLNPEPPSREETPTTLSINEFLLGANTAIAAVKNINNAFPTVSAKIVPVKSFSGKERDLSRCPIKLVFHNTGSEAIENCYINITSENPDVTFAETDVVKHNSLFPSFQIADPHISIDEDEISARFDLTNPLSSCLVCKAFICIPYGVKQITLRWKMSSRYFLQEGELNITVEPKMEYDTQTNREKAGTEEIIPCIIREDSDE